MRGKNDGFGEIVGGALEALKIGANVRGVLIAEVAIFFEGLIDDALEFRRTSRLRRTGATGARLRMASKMCREDAPEKACSPVAIS